MKFLFLALVSAVSATSALSSDTANEVSSHRQTNQANPQPNCRLEARNICRQCQRQTERKFNRGRCTGADNCQKKFDACLQRFDELECEGTLLETLEDRNRECLLPEEIRCRAEGCPFCVEDESVCEPNGGQCQPAVVSFLTGDLFGSVSLAKYGRYCGRDVKCSLLEGCDEATRPAPCDDGGLDAACFAHDDCLDAAIDRLDESKECFVPGNPNGPQIPEAERVACTATFVSQLYDVFARGEGPTGLCDAAFYDVTSVPIPGGIALTGHESVYLAGAFCGLQLFQNGASTGSGCVDHPHPGCVKAGYLCCVFNARLTGALAGSPPDDAGILAACGPAPPV